MLGGDGEASNIVYHALKDRIPIARVVLEEAAPPSVLIRSRLKSLGAVAVAGQIAFRGLVVPLLRRASRKRVLELKRRFALCDEPIPPALVDRVSSVNSEETIHHLRALGPKVVLVHGTRIISRRVLDRVPATFVNMHAGITPAYRGVHGGYWALARRDRARCGVTVHLVDAGIDTGPVIAQTTFVPEEGDTFVTYPYHQLHAGIPLLERALRDALAGRLQLTPPAAGDSRLWSHPTLGQYARNWLRTGVR